MLSKAKARGFSSSFIGAPVDMVVKVKPSRTRSESGRLRAPLYSGRGAWSVAMGLGGRALGSASDVASVTSMGVHCGSGFVTFSVTVRDVTSPRHHT
jgi:hypothetical protein